MRIWVDFSAPAHPIVLRPVIERLRGAGHQVEVTARDYAQTLGLADRLGIAYERFGAHGGAGAMGKLRALASRSTALLRWARPRRFDLAIAHGSNDLPLVARMLGVPAVDMFDYEWATFQHTIGCRCARRVLTPDAIPPERLRRYGAGPDKLRQFPGLKEEYYLADFAPDPAVLDELGIDRGRTLAVVRPPPEVSLYHRTNPLFVELIRRLGGDPAVHAVVLPRTADQRDDLKAAALPSLIVPDTAIDAQSLIAFADVVASAGGTMNREAVALGTPVYTTFSGRLGGVDEALIAAGRLRRLVDPSAIPLTRHAGERQVTRRDPALLVELMLETAT